MVEIIGIQTEQEAKQIYAEAEKKLKEKNTEVDKWNAKEKATHKKTLIGSLLMAILSAICFFVSDSIWNVFSVFLGLFMFLYSLIELLYPIETFEHKNISEFLPVSYEYYELIKKYGEPISTKLATDGFHLSLVFSTEDEVIVRKTLYVDEFKTIEKRNLETTIIDLMNECIYIPYEQ